AAQRVVAARARVRAGLAQQGRALELGLLETIERALPADAITCWDMTILAYWAAAHLRLHQRQSFLYPLGSGTLGYAWPAALGASVAHPDATVLAVVGDGGVQYALAELGAAAAHGLRAKLLIVDDGGYGILREYQRQDYEHTTAVELPGKDLCAIAAANGLPARAVTPDDFAAQLDWLLSCDGAGVLVLGAHLVAAAPTT
ncbi:MAG: thiamine pyrophosphate-dependent enzyme, partial [Solirubrobacteraceae bacterium]